MGIAALRAAEGAYSAEARLHRGLRREGSVALNSPTGLITEAILTPVMLFGSDREVRYANPAARKTLDGRFGLLLQASKLLVRDVALHARLQTAIDSVLSAGQAQSAIHLPPDSSGQRAVLHLAAAEGGLSDSDANGGDRAALVGVIHYEQSLQVEELARLRNILGLSAVEAEIAAQLCCGYSPKEIAKRRTSTEHTVRWHIKNIHSKTHTHRLTDLLVQIQAARTPFWQR
jgi:DNA-binding CsgD family transcriptional regulator